MEETKTNAYQGWTNYETWGVALIIDNDELAKKRAREYAAQHTPLALEDWLKKTVEHMVETSPYGVRTLMIAQLVGAALSRVNWRELAKHYQEG